MRTFQCKKIKKYYIILNVSKREIETERESETYLIKSGRSKETSFNKIEED